MMSIIDNPKKGDVFETDRASRQRQDSKPTYHPALKATFFRMKL